MKRSKPIHKALAFLIDNFMVYFTANLLATFLNPYDNSAENQTNFIVIYIAVLLIYITYAETKYKTTLGKKILNIKS